MNTILNYLDVHKSKVSFCFFDLDGTLLDSNKCISNRTLHILIQGKKAGLHFGIATGRALSSIYPLIKKYQLQELLDVVIANSGADLLLLPTMKYIKNGYVSIDQVKMIITSFSALEDITIAFHNPGSLFVTKPTPLMEQISQNNQEQMVLVENSHKEWEEPARVMLEFHRPETLQTILSILIPNLKGYWTEKNIYEFLNENVSKAKAIQMYVRSNGSNLEHVMVFGDGDNDAEMLEAASMGIAMKNASEQAKQAANMILEHTNDEDGIYYFLKEFLK